MQFRIRYSSNHSLRVSGSSWFLRDNLCDMPVFTSPESDSRALESGWQMMFWRSGITFWRLSNRVCLFLLNSYGSLMQYADFGLRNSTCDYKMELSIWHGRFISFVLLKQAPHDFDTNNKSQPPIMLSWLVGMYVRTYARTYVRKNVRTYVHT